MENSIKVALAQINSKVGDLEYNYSKISKIIKIAKKQKVDLLCFPELAITGYPPEDLLLNNKFIKSTDAFIKKIAKLSKGTTCIIGYPKKINDKLFNVAGIFLNGKLQGEYKKFQLPNYGVFDENRYFEKGIEEVSFKIKNQTVGISICEDIWTDLKIINERISRNDIDLLVNLSASPFSIGKQKKRLNILKKISTKNRIKICYCNLVGGQDELVFDGKSMILDRNGNVEAYGKEFEEDILIRSLKFKETKSFNKTLKTKEESEPEQIYSALSLGLKDYVEKNGFSKVVLGVSGGIDSALVSAIAVNTLGGKNVLGLALPTIYNSFKSLSLAIELAKNLQFDLSVAPIQDLFEATNKLLVNSYGKKQWDVTEENLQSRIRANILMATSNKLGHLLLATGNKSEISVGYSTLYGDSAGGIAILKDIPKTLVYKLAKFHNKIHPKKMIPLGILKREPSAELRDNQKDLDTLPPYKILDQILELYIEEGKSASYIAKSINIKKSIASSIIKKVNNSEFKRRQSPPGIKITSKAFGRDRRYPITNGFIDA